MTIISDATFWSVTLESSITLLEESFTLLEVSFTTFTLQATVAMIVNYGHYMFLVNTTWFNLI